MEIKTVDPESSRVGSCPVFLPRIPYALSHSVVRSPAISKNFQADCSTSMIKKYLKLL